MQERGPGRVYFHLFVAPGPEIPRAFGDIDEFRPYFPLIGEHYYDNVIVSGLSLKRDMLILAMEMVRAFGLDYLDYDICLSERDCPFRFEVPRMANVFLGAATVVHDFHIGKLECHAEAPRILLDVHRTPVSFRAASDKVWITMREYHPKIIDPLLDIIRTGGGAYDPQTRLYYNEDKVELLSEAPFAEDESAGFHLGDWKFVVRY